MRDLIEKEFGIKPIEIKRIDGYENANYIVSTDTKKYIFKTYHYDKALFDIVSAEIDVLRDISSEDQHCYPQAIPFNDGSFIKIIEQDGIKLFCRMLSFLEGVFFGDMQPTQALFTSFGTFIAQMDLRLKKVSNHVLNSRRWQWDLQFFTLNKQFLSDIPDPINRHLIDFYLLQFEEWVLPVLPDLRTQLIHGDANEWNVLCTDGKVSGIIDFGDITHSQLINELAIGLTYACLNIEDPLAWMPHMIRAYNKIIPLKALEISILYYLIAARLCTSLCNAAHSRKINPANSYATQTEDAALDMLKRWIRINPIAAENTFREAVGFQAHPAPHLDALIQYRHTHISRSLSISYNTPVAINHAAFQYMYDVYGNTFLDAYNNIPHVGHNHPKVVRAGQRQMARLNTNTRYLYDLLPQYAETLLSKFPPSLNKIFFVNSGSAATDLAIRLAQHHTKKENIMVVRHGYHGNTQIGTDISDYKFSHPDGQGQKAHIIKTEIPDTFNGRYQGGDASQRYAEEAIDLIQKNNRSIAAFIAEPIVGCGGQVPLAPHYLKAIYPAIREQGGVCISDEVQTGFGRLGQHYWGYEMHGVIPDMVILGKPMANGHPIGAVVTTDAIAHSFESGPEFFSSFGGNPVSCAIGLSVLELIDEEDLQSHAQSVGRYYKSRLNSLKDKHPCIGDVRGEGLFLGIEIVDKQQNPHTALAQYLKNGLRENFILVSTDGPYENVIKSKPPLCFTRENVEEVVNIIDRLLNEHYTIS